MVLVSSTLSCFFNSSHIIGLDNQQQEIRLVRIWFSFLTRTSLILCSETCIKGHRSSSCRHTDRALFEIKKKGRPVTQCEHCRELRKTKQVHVKCVCETKSSDSQGVSTTPLPLSSSCPKYSMLIDKILSFLSRLQVKF